MADVSVSPSEDEDEHFLGQTINDFKTRDEIEAGKILAEGALYSNPESIVTLEESDVVSEDSENVAKSENDIGAESVVKGKSIVKRLIKSKHAEEELSLVENPVETPVRKTTAGDSVQAWHKASPVPFGE